MVNETTHIYHIGMRNIFYLWRIYGWESSLWNIYY